MTCSNSLSTAPHRRAAGRTWRRAAAWPLVLVAAIVSATPGCVGMGPGSGSASASLRALHTAAPVATAPTPIASDDDRVMPAALGPRPRALPVLPRVEPIRRGAPNLPYTIGDERFVPTRQDVPIRESGIASWYGEPFHGRLTANGETYDMHAMTAAHPTMPLPSYALVRHVASGRQVIVRVNDRGPFVGGRVIDLSFAAAQRLGIDGVARVEVVRLTHDDIRRGRWFDPAVRLASADVLPRR